MNPKVDPYFEKQTTWQNELRLLRSIILECGLVEELKWGVPCYVLNKTNVVMLGAFKDSCVLSFLKGALLSDSKGILGKIGENTQAARVFRVTDIQQIEEHSTLLKTYIFEALEVEKAGLSIAPKKTSEYAIPDELKAKLDADAVFKIAYEALTPGRKNGYLLHFSQAKQAATRASRIEACTSRILAGKGLHDCICGHSKKMPRCDGSHQHFS